VLYDQEDVQTHYRTDEFVFGEQILVCPVQEPNAKGRRMYVPKGNWYNFWTDEVVKGGKEMWVDADIDSMPIFVKEGAVIPKYPIQQYVGEKEITEITLDVYYKKGKEKSELYSDANDGYDYTKGRYSLRTFNLTGRTNELIINQHKEGKFITPYDTFKIKIHGLPFEIGEIQLDNEKVSLDTLKINGTLTFIVDKNFSELHVISK
jgi:alpha-glucosidase